MPIWCLRISNASSLPFCHEKNGVCLISAPHGINAFQAVSSAISTQSPLVGHSDIAVVRQTPGWGTTPIAFSDSDGTWTITNGSAPKFIPSWANQPGVRIVTGDFR